MKRRALLSGAVAATVLPLGFSSPASARTRENFLVATTEQRTNRLLIFNRDDEWNSGTIQWSWESSSSGWYNLSDVRFRDTKHFGQVVLAAASGGNVGIIDKSDAGGQLLWAAAPGGNPHATERIPNLGAIVSASSDGYLTVYGPTAISDPSTLAQVQTVELPGAHGLLWDPSLNLLWAIGDKVVRAYEVTGQYRQVRLKATDSQVALAGMGHDLQPDYADPAKLLVTDTEAVYELDVATLTATPILQAAHVKAYVRHTSGVALWVQAEDVEPRPWSSPTVHFSDGDRILADAQFYKARIVSSAFE